MNILNRLGGIIMDKLEKMEKLNQAKSKQITDSNYSGSQRNFCDRY